MAANFISVIATGQSLDHLFASLLTVLIVSCLVWLAIYKLLGKDSIMVKAMGRAVNFALRLLPKTVLWSMALVGRAVIGKKVENRVPNGRPKK